MNYQESLKYIADTHKFGIRLGLDSTGKLLELLGNPQENLKVVHVAGTNGKGSSLKYIADTHKFGIRLGLDSTGKLLELLGNPQENLKVVHVAGTNGKGSVCSFVANILKEEGYKVGLYTSPYLETFTERIRVNGENIPEEDVARIITIIKDKIEIMVSEGYSAPTEFEIVTAMAERIRVNGENIPEEDVARIITIIKDKIEIMVSEGYSAPTEFEIVTAMAFYYYNEQKMEPEEDVARIITIIKDKIEIMVSEGYSAPTEFEIVTAMAFYYYNEQKMDYVVLEVGLGGRFDSTNVIKNPLVSVLVSISLDHIGVLGDTIGKIAYEKAGIIKENGAVIVYKQVKEAEDVIKEVCNEKSANYIEVNFNDVEVKKSDIYSQVYDCIVMDEKFDNLEIKLIGDHQINNSIVALNVIKYLRDNKNVEVSNESIEKGLLEKFDNLEIKLIGDHQINNSIVALNVIKYLRDNKNVEVSNESIEKGLLNTKWPGRIEKIKENPMFIIDGAHNEDGAKSLGQVE